MGRYLSTGSTALAPTAADESCNFVKHLRCSAALHGNRRHLAHCRPRLRQQQPSVAATPAKPSTMATGQAPCGLSGYPAEQV